MYSKEMSRNFLFQFQSNIEDVILPETLNNPFGGPIPEVAQIAARQFQDFITTQLPNWEHDFSIHKGKMFGVLVVQTPNKEVGFLATISGKLSGDKTCERFTPSVFDDATDDFFINKGMKELTEIGTQIKKSNSSLEILGLKEVRHAKSTALQNRLFENYIFVNLKGEKRNVIEIFEDSIHSNPPAAAGECAAPKLLHFALENNLKPVAIAEFWWGKSPKSEERTHLSYYPACKNKCRPILEFILADKTLFEKRNAL